MKKAGIGLVAVLLLLMGSLSAAAATPVLLDQKMLALDKGQLSILEDPNHELTWEEALDAQRAGRFKQLSYGVGEGYSTSVFWVYVQLERSPASPELWGFFSSPVYLDRVEYHVIQQGELLQVLSAGDLVADPEHDLHHRLPFVGTRLPEGPVELLVRLETSSTSVLLIQAVPGDRIDAAIEGRVMSEGILIGILLMVLLINLLNGVWLRRSLFIYFVTYEASMLVTILFSNGFMRDLVPGMTEAEQNLLMQFSVLFTGLLAFVFFQRMLNFQYIGSRWVNGLFLIGIGLALTGMIFAYQNQYAVAMSVVNTYVSSFPLVVSVPLLLSWRQMDSEQRFRAGGFFIFGIFVAVNCLYTIGYMPVTVGTTYIAPLMILSFQLSLHFILMFSVRKSEALIRAAKRAAEESRKEAGLERSLRLSHELFMDMFSHEVRTPLAVIDTSAQSLQKLESKRTDGEQHGKRYQRIRDAVTRINLLLQMSILRSSGEFESSGTKPQQYDVIPVLVDVLNEFPSAARERIKIHGSDQPLVFNGLMPAEFLGVLMRNLIDNALKYSPGDTDVSVYISISGHNLELIVRDKGPGMDQYVCEHMFDRHFRANENAAVPGLGLGLFVVKEAVERFNGWIDVETGKSGTEIRVRLQGFGK
ncbi:sensor histidine kinase [Marinobacterium sediminicola]|uniref:sensor histidine kinase n=1 Tax=Marinobacterium sediminicola TaxID=518898 RepID=UPI001EF10F2F|nr:ATP-binding protein [Marinobacterium sediminicola]ULG68216.1 sensor histidine kinase [Marinobacterium sediminicola]